MTIASLFKSKGSGEGAKNVEPGGARQQPVVSQVEDEAHQPVFGIKSYIHQFYDWKSAMPFDEVEGWHVTPTMMAKSRRIICIFRFCAILGLCLLIGGAVAIMIGYVEPRDSISIALKRHQVTVNDDGDLLISAEVINRLKDDKLKHWKLIGLITFAMGGIFLVISLLIPSCAKMCGHSTFISELNSPNEPPIKIYQQTDEEGGIAGSTGAQGAPPRSPTEKMVPTVEQVTAVQPDEKKLRRTSAGNEDAMLLDEK